MRFSANRAESMRNFLDGKPTVTTSRPAAASRPRPVKAKEQAPLVEAFYRGLRGPEESHKTKDIPIMDPVTSFIDSLKRLGVL